MGKHFSSALDSSIEFLVPPPSPVTKGTGEGPNNNQPFLVFLGIFCFAAPASQASSSNQAAIYTQQPTRMNSKLLEKLLAPEEEEMTIFDLLAVFQRKDGDGTRQSTIPFGS